MTNETTTHTTATDAPEQLPEGVELLWMRPGDLIVDANVRTNADITPEFRQSIRDLGVLVPVAAVRAPEGIKVQKGKRRTITADEEQVPGMPVYVVPDGGDVERIVGQLAENHDRAATTQADTAAAYEQLSLLGLSVSQIAKRTRRTKAEITAGLTVAKSQDAATAADTFALDLVDAAVFAEFTGDDDALRTLHATAERGGSVEHTAQRIRDERARTAAVQDCKTALTDAGVRIISRPGHYDTTVREVAALRAKGSTTPLSVEEHATCPGHAAWVAGEHSGRDVEAVYACTDYKTHGHLRWTDPTETTPKVPRSDAERAEARQVRENNAAWRSAETVRRAWLPRIAARKSPPKGAAEFVARTVVRNAHALSVAADKGHRLAARLLGHSGEYGGSAHVADLLSKASTPRGQVIALVVALAAIEESTDIYTWRHTNPDSPVAVYLRTLETWGYGLSEIEHHICGRTPDPAPAATVVEPVTDAA